jgi:hypothetical protein
MLNHGQMSLLVQHSAKGDWSAAQDVCAELAGDPQGTQDEFQLEELQLAVRLRDAERLAVIVGELKGGLEPGSEEERSSGAETESHPSDD